MRIYSPYEVGVTIPITQMWKSDKERFSKYPMLPIVNPANSKAELKLCFYSFKTYAFSNISNLQHEAKHSTFSSAGIKKLLCKEI